MFSLQIVRFKVRRNINNTLQWATYNEPPYEPYREPTFENGARRSRQSLIAALGGRLGIDVC